MERHFCVYILASGRNGTLYTGVTSDLIKRVWQHKNHHVEGFTEKYDVHDLGLVRAARERRGRDHAREADKGMEASVEA